MRIVSSLRHGHSIIAVLDQRAAGRVERSDGSGAQVLIARSARPSMELVVEIADQLDVRI